MAGNDCECREGPYYPCSTPGGCGHGLEGGSNCASGTACKAFDRAAGRAYPTSDPLCPACLDAAERDIRALVYDYIDLEQLHETSMSQAINEKTAGSKEKTMLLVAHVEALQAEIVHVVTTWEVELRAAGRLSEAPERARAGAHVQRAINIIAPRVERLSKLPATAVYRTGCEDPIEDITGWEAIHHLTGLHSRARATLGRTTRTFYIPGDCWACGARPVPDVPGPLYRSEPRFERDPMQVTCEPCGASRPYADYEHLQRTLMWPDQETDQLVRVAA